MFFLYKRENIISVLTNKRRRIGDEKPIYLNSLRGKNPDEIDLYAPRIFETKGSAQTTKKSLSISREAVIAALSLIDV